MLEEPVEKVTACNVAGMMVPTPALLLPGMAKEAEVMVRSVPPKVLEIWKRAGGC